MKKFLATFWAIFCFTIPVVAQAANGVTESEVGRFIDVSHDRWYCSAVEFVVKEGMMGGTSLNTFSPEDDTTRGMFMTILARHAGVNVDGSQPWYQIGMDWVATQGISDGTNPDMGITREQLAVILWKYADKPSAVGSLAYYSDAASVSPWATKAMIWAVQNKIITGDEKGLNPQNTASRAETAAMLMRFSEVPLGPRYEADHRLQVPVTDLTDGLELPVSGATGYTSVNMQVWKRIPSRTSNAGMPLVELEAGSAFRIVREEGDWWYITLEHDGKTISGYIEHRYCMINLPDVIPSIIYNDTNAYSSIFRSIGKDIPYVTGQAFYDSSMYNERLGKTEFVMPMLYASARDVCAAQHKALSEGNCLVIYQTFRPMETQSRVVAALSRMVEIDDEVRMGVANPPWNIGWFISTNISNHQRGYALDVSMVKVDKAVERNIGHYSFLETVDYKDYEMPTEMHELSSAAASMKYPTSTELSETMNRPAIALRGYFVESGFSPLASEWWHFNHDYAGLITEDNPSIGWYFLTECLSQIP